MKYFSEIEEALGSLDSVDMESAFCIDKYDFKSDMAEMEDILSPYLSMLSPLDKTLYDMYFTYDAKVEHIASYLDISSAAVYKRIRNINLKLKLVIYLNMNKEELYNFLKDYFINDNRIANYFVQFVFHRTSKVGEEDFNFETITIVTKCLEKAYNAGADNLSNYTSKAIKRNNKRNYARLNIKRILEVVDFIIEKKAYRYGIFRGDLTGTYTP